MSRETKQSMNLLRFWAVAAVLSLTACATGLGTRYPDPAQIDQLLPADAILLGEQHDAPDHQRIHRFVVEALAARQTLAALALEMANEGQSTEKLGPKANEEAVRTALQWGSGAWSWDVYGPVVMAAVRAGIPVVGANLPRTGMRDLMNDAGFDALLPAPALAAQQQRIRQGHCNLLPEAQVAPMARIQIARDIAMARTVAKLVQPGKTVLLLAGSGHVDRSLGVAQHLPAKFSLRAVLLHGEPIPDVEKHRDQFDQFWATRPAPKVDHCAQYLAHRNKAAAASAVAP